MTVSDETIKFLAQQMRHYASEFTPGDETEVFLNDIADSMHPESALERDYWKLDVVKVGDRIAGSFDATSNINYNSFYGYFEDPYVVTEIAYEHDSYAGAEIVICRASKISELGDPSLDPTRIEWHSSPDYAPLLVTKLNEKFLRMPTKKELLEPETRTTEASGSKAEFKADKGDVGDAFEALYNNADKVYRSMDSLINKAGFLNVLKSRLDKLNQDLEALISDSWQQDLTED